jgi:hypothetical protein
MESKIKHGVRTLTVTRKRLLSASSVSHFHLRMRIPATVMLNTGSTASSTVLNSFMGISNWSASCPNSQGVPVPRAAAV